MLLTLGSLALAGVPCGLADRLGEELPAPPLPPAALGGTKLVRDAYGVPNGLETENFVIRWGNEAPVDQADIDALAASLEQVWQVEIVEHAYPMPLTAIWYKLNVYIGDTGSGAPESVGAAGYYWYDDESYPMLVLSSLTVDDPDYAEAVAAHEFFHGVQAAAGTYAFTEVDFWYWEATATWITSQVFPGNPHYASLLFGQAFLPHESIHGYFYGAGGVYEFHPYGAFLFVTWLSEIGADAALVRRSWLDAPTGGDPILVVERELAPLGWTLESAFFDFARRNAVWDYADAALYTASIETSGGWASPESTRPVGTLDGPVEPFSSTGPHTLGADYWLLEDLPTGTELSFDGDAGPAWEVTVAGARDGEPVYLAMSLVDGVGSLALTDHEDWSEAWLVVAAVDGTLDAGPVGTYRLASTLPAGEIPPSETTTEPEAAPDAPVARASSDGGCGCGAAPRPAGAWPLLLMVFAAAAGGLRRSHPVRPRYAGGFTT